MSAAKFRSAILIVLLFIGAMLIAANAVNIERNWEYQKAAAGKTTAEIIEIYARRSDMFNEKVYNKAIVYVNYTIGSTVYTSTLTQFNKVLNVGQKITVYYDKSNPAHLYREPDYLNFLYTIGGIMFFAAVVLMWNIPNIA
ncbi:MAG: DUF3592 domain-containing protein [Firmicutes bacterium]|nr:DUF3592 domain-containing protein [Bacillota bacterium]